jgi:hypothetical protein
MKLLLSIDQKASLLAGLDAPHSSLMLDISPASIPADHRAILMPCYDVASGRVNPYFTICPKYGSRLTVSIPDVLSNAGEPEALAAIAEFVRLTAEADARRAANAEEYEAEKLATAAKEAEKIRQALEGMLNGSRAIVNISFGRVILSEGIISVTDLTPEALAIVDAWKAAKAETETEAKRKAEEAAAAKKARQIKDQDWFTEAIDSGTVNHRDCFGNLDTHRMAKNWIATVAHAPSSPGGLDRTFWSGKSSAREIPADLAPGDYVEAGSKDKKGRSGHRYFRILEITADSITFRNADKPGKTPPDVTAEIQALNAIRAMA